MVKQATSFETNEWTVLIYTNRYAKRSASTSTLLRVSKSLRPKQDSPAFQEKDGRQATTTSSADQDLSVETLNGNPHTKMSECQHRYIDCTSPATLMDSYDHYDIHTEEIVCISPISSQPPPSHEPSSSTHSIHIHSPNPPVHIALPSPPHSFSASLSSSSSPSSFSPKDLMRKVTSLQQRTSPIPKIVNNMNTTDIDDTDRPGRA